MTRSEGSGGAGRRGRAGLAIRRMVFPALFGVIGVLILCALGTWQVQRMQWKAGVLAEISARIAAAPVAVPAAPDPERDRYLPVVVQGRFTGEVIEVLSGKKNVGAGVRVIEVFALVDGTRLMVDRGFLAEAARGAPRASTAGEVTGNLQWPRDGDAYTPPPDAKTGLWFARDVAQMAAYLRATPVLIVASAQTGDGIEAMGVDTSSIPNDHLGYAVTWFLLALVWGGMTVYLLWRIGRQTV